MTTNHKFLKTGKAAQTQGQLSSPAHPAQLAMFILLVCRQCCNNSPDLAHVSLHGAPSHVQKHLQVKELKQESKIMGVAAASSPGLFCPCSCWSLGSCAGQCCTQPVRVWKGFEFIKAMPSLAFLCTHIWKPECPNAIGKIANKYQVPTI